MDEIVTVRIDLSRIAASIAAAEQQPCSLEEVRQWLKECGFLPHQDGAWVARKGSLTLLNSDEYTLLSSPGSNAG